MRRIATALLVVGVLAGGASGEAPESFLKTWAEVSKAAKAQDKPMFLHFTTTWCGWCRKIEKDVYATEAGRKALEGFITASLDCTVPRGQSPEGDTKTHIELLRKFGGSGFPFLVMLTPDGAVLNSFGGYKPAAGFKAELDKARQTHKDYKQLQADAKTKGKTYEFKVRAMKVYARLQQTDKAVAAATGVRKLDPENKKGDGADAALVLLNAALAKPDDAGAAALLGDIRKLDAGNDAGVLQEALFAAAGSHLARAQASREPDPAASTRHLRAAVSLLMELGETPKVADRQLPMAYLGQTHLALGEKDKALATFEKALVAAPDSRIAPRIRQLIQRLKKPGPPPAQQN